jgi:hypothetical protein
MNRTMVLNISASGIIGAGLLYRGIRLFFLSWLVNLPGSEHFPSNKFS